MAPWDRREPTVRCMSDQDCAGHYACPPRSGPINNGWGACEPACLYQKCRSKCDQNLSTSCTTPGGGEYSSCMDQQGADGIRDYYCIAVLTGNHSCTYDSDCASLSCP